jgi:hypothetical protein
MWNFEVMSDNFWHIQDMYLSDKFSQKENITATAAATTSSSVVVVIVVQ